MPNGKIRLYNKLTNAQLVELDITGIFNIEDNLNDTPSNAKFKVVTSNTYREEFEVNTVIYHADTSTWWVIKSDESTYLHTGEYEHEIQVVEYLEWFAYKHLPNCAFAPSTYSLEQMLERLFKIAKLDVEMVYPAFLDKDKIMPFMSFENFTVANAIKNIARAINAIPKAYVDITSGYQPKLTFINRSGLDTAIVNNLNDYFPTAYERNINSNDQFTTRSISNIQNAKSSNLVIAPLRGGFKNISIESPEYVADTAKIYLPSKIDSVKQLNVYPRVSLVYITFDGSNLVYNPIYKGYYFDEEFWFQKFEDSLTTTNKIKLYDGTELTVTSTIYGELNALTLGDFPVAQEQSLVNSTDTISTTYDDTESPWFKNKMVIKSRFDYNLEDTTSIKERISYYEPNTNTIVMSKRFREGLSWSSLQSSIDMNPFYKIYRSSNSIVYDSLYLMVDRDLTGLFADKTYSPNILVQVSYYPIADIKVSIDNDNDAQDEKYFNQNGKVIDALSVSKLITSHTNDSVEGTKIRNARYGSPDYDYTDILPLGQIVRDNNQLYIISQRSIDATIKNGNEYYNVVYTLSRNRIGRSENIVADSAVINYKIPDDNLVFRTQLYKDYIELSLTDGNNDTPYLSMSKALVLDGSLAGTNFDYTVVAKNDYGSPTSISRYVKNPMIYDLHKAKLMNVNWQDNNVLGYRVERNSNQNPIQTPIVYTDSTGKATNFNVLFLDTQNIDESNADYNTPTEIDALVPFGDLTTVPSTYYSSDVLGDGRYSIRIQEADYDKDAFEIPVFEYMLQANDDYDPKGNIVVGNDLFSTFTGDIRYHYIINNTTRFTAENANALYLANAPTGINDRRVTFVRDLVNTPTVIELDLFSNFGTSTRNTTDITNVGVYAVQGGTGVVKFLFAINDYTLTDNDDITIYINNWKI